MSVHCPMCHDGWPRVWDGRRWRHDLPSPAGEFSCTAADADRAPVDHNERTAA
jgi:hypothetical protein